MWYLLLIVEFRHVFAFCTVSHAITLSPYNKRHRLIHTTHYFKNLRKGAEIAHLVVQDHLLLFLYSTFVLEIYIRLIKLYNRIVGLRKRKISAYHSLSILDKFFICQLYLLCIEWNSFQARTTIPYHRCPIWNVFLRGDLTRRTPWILRVCFLVIRWNKSLTIYNVGMNCVCSFKTNGVVNKHALVVIVVAYRVISDHHE